METLVRRTVAQAWAKLQRRIQRGAKGAQAPVRFKLPNFLKIEIIGFCLNKSNFHANHAHHTHNAQNWSVEPLSDFRLDPPVTSITITSVKSIYDLDCIDIDTLVYKRDPLSMT